MAKYLLPIPFTPNFNALVEVQISTFFQG